jgi:hypothetical protein
MSHRSRQSLLGHVFGILTLAQQSPAQTEHRPLKSLQKLSQPGRFAAQATLHQPRLFHGDYALMLEELPRSGVGSFMAEPDKQKK